MRRFRFSALPALAAIGLASVASAADLPAKAPVYKAPVATPAYSWTGFYLGVNAGGSVGRNPTTQSSDAVVVETFNMSPAGLVGGGQFGYNYQFAPNWVAGVEADFQGTGQKDSTCLANCAAAIVSPPLTTTQKLSWFATARARLGYTDGDWLYYVTGGGAWGQIRQDYALPPFAGTAGAVSASHSNGGWVAGGGVETHLAGAWTAKVEYLYLDLGSISDTFTTTGGPPVTYTTSSDIRNHIIRAGLNYKFYDAGNPGARPVSGASAMAAPAFSWTGFYLGVNAGGSVGRNPTIQSWTGYGVLETFNMSPAGFVGGGQFGYNYQFAPNWVAGIEADFQGTGQKDSTCLFICTGSPLDPLTTTQKLSWFATARARLGYTDGDWLYYVTGGGAWGQIRQDYAFSQGPNIGAVSASHSNGGWVAGGGVETHLAGGWTAKVEYLYLDLGSIRDTLTTASTPLTFTTSSDIRDHIVRAGLNYKFD
jgi:outer membrane immunogenic protein